MKNLKSIDEHRKLIQKIKDGGRVITYGMRDETYVHYAESFLPREAVMANFDGDENKWGKRLDMGAMTLPPDQLAPTADMADGIIVMCAGISQIGEFMDGLGVDYYYGRIMQEKIHPDICKNMIQPEADKVEANKANIDFARSLLADDLSLKVYDSLLSARLSVDSLERFNLIRNAYTNDQYFPANVPGFFPAKDEVFVDGGAFDGDTIKRFIELTGGEYKHIHAFEPDLKNFAKLEEFAASHKNITCYRKGLYSVETTLEFMTTGSSASYFQNSEHAHIPSDGNYSTMRIDVCSLDKTRQDKTINGR